MGKDRRHNQYLHGWGTVCGLKVLEHPNPACRKQYVVVTAGVAVDCCGREILVRNKAMLDFRSAFLEAWQKLHGKEKQADNMTHSLELANRYAGWRIGPGTWVCVGLRRGH